MLHPTSIHPEQLANALDREVERLVEDTEPVDWHEDSISFNLVQAVRKVLRLHSCIQLVRSPRYSADKYQEQLLFLDVEIYKVTGKPERKHGDIAVVVRNEELHRTGVGFYEAKAQGVMGNFPAFSRRQFQRLSTCTPLLFLLLYHRSPEPVGTNASHVPYTSEDRRSLDTSRVRVFRANEVRLFGNPVSIPWEAQRFGSHFVGDFLTGKSLDYSREPEKAVERWLKATKRASPLVVSVRLSRSPLAFETQPPLLLSDMEPVPMEVPMHAVRLSAV